MDPGPRFAHAAGGDPVVEDALQVEPGSFDLCVVMGTLDTVNNLPEALARLRFALRPGGLLIGVMIGGDTLPQLRLAMQAADEVAGTWSPHVHPRVEPASLGGLLVSAGLVDAVVDVDRVDVAYSSFMKLVADLRAMAATNILTKRSLSPLSRTAAAKAAATFASKGLEGSTTERFELLHFAGWAPAQG